MYNMYNINNNNNMYNEYNYYNMNDEELLSILLNETIRIPPPIRRQYAFRNLLQINNYIENYDEEPLYRTNYTFQENEINTEEIEINIEETEIVYRSFCLLPTTSLERSNSESNLKKTNIQPISLKKINTF